MENQGQFDFDPEKFDFCIHRKKKNQKVKQDIVMDTPKKIKTLLPKTKATVIENSLPISSNIPVTTLVSTSNTAIKDGGMLPFFNFILTFFIIFYLFYFFMLTYIRTNLL